MTRIKQFSLLAAVMLCMTVFLLPLTAFAATETTPPSINAWLNGDTLHIEASDADSGVETIYVDSHRFNYTVDGVLEVNARDNHDNNEKISVYAVDFAGNKSSVIQIKNPYYKAASSQPTQPPAQGTTPAPNPTQTPALSSSTPTTPRPSSSATAPSASSSSEPTSQPTQTSAPTEEQQPFTPDGTGTVVDDVIQINGKEFLVIETPDGNIFYLIIDRSRDENGVYLLNAVTEEDLASLAKEGDGKPQGAIPTPESTTQPDPKPDPQPEPTPEPEPEKESGGIGTIFLILLAVAAIGGAGWYFKIYKPKQDAELSSELDDEDEDENDEDEIEFENMPEDSEDDYSDGNDEETDPDDYEDEE